MATKLNFFIHNLAQMKFTSSEDRPTLSFAPRVHTARSDGVIKNLYICRHMRTANTSKGYVSTTLLPWQQTTLQKHTGIIDHLNTGSRWSLMMQTDEHLL